jgi:hypothetical protein
VVGKQSAPPPGVGIVLQTGFPKDSCTTVRRYAATLIETVAPAVLTAATLLCHAGQYGPSNFVGPTGAPMVT